MDSNLQSINESIELAAGERQAHWQKPWQQWTLDNVYRTHQLTKELDDLYHEKRKARAQGWPQAKAN